MSDRTSARRALAATAVLALATACTTTTPQEEGADTSSGERGHAHGGDLTVSGAWMPEPANPEVGALYLEVANDADEDDALTGVSSDASETAELHTTEDGQMVEVEQIPVPAGGSVELAPGGHHIMIMEIPEPLTEGDEFTAELSFAGGTEVELTVPVEEVPGQDGHDHGEHGEHDHGEHEEDGEGESGVDDH